MQQLFRTLHPLVSFHRDTLSVVKCYTGRADLRERGLLLVPCVFAWPDVIVRTANPQPSVSYSPRGLGRLWEGPAAPRSSPLAAVIGRTRAAILAQLDLPISTSQLACLLDLTAPTLSVHLKTLEAAGILAARRTPLNRPLRCLVGRRRLNLPGRPARMPGRWDRSVDPLGGPHDAKSAPRGPTLRLRARGVRGPPRSLVRIRLRHG